MKYIFCLIGVFLLTSCNNSKNSQEFINSTKGKYLFNSNETLEVYFIDDILKTVATSNRPLINFPQGTRVLPDERPPFKKGASRIYEELNVACQPVAINSGYVWPKKGNKKSNKTITISILKPIPSGLTKENFIQILEKNIYSELDLIN